MSAAEREEPVTPDAIMALSGVSLFDGSPFVALTWGAGGDRAQLTPELARDLALNVLQAADAAEFDAGLVAELRRIGMEDEPIAALLWALREGRP